MPSIRLVESGDIGEVLVIAAATGARVVLRAEDVPQGLATPADVEAWLTDTWAPQHVDGYQIAFHVLSVSPLRLTVHTADLGASVENGWWESSDEDQS